jgi:hypothetical protein
MHVVTVMSVVFLLLACVSWYEAVTTSSWVAWLETSEDQPLRQWLISALVLGCVVWLFLRARTPIVRAVFALLGTSLALHRAEPFLAGPAAWLGFLYAALDTVGFVLCCSAVWRYRRSADRTEHDGA